MPILKRLLGLKRETTAKEKKKIYKGVKRTRTVTKGVDKEGRKWKKVSVREKPPKDSSVRSKGRLVKSKSVIKGEKGTLISGKKVLPGRKKHKEKHTKRVTKHTEHNPFSGETSQVKIKRLSKQNKGKAWMTGKKKRKRL